MAKNFSVRMKMTDGSVKQISIGNAQHRGARDYQEDSFGYTKLENAARDGFVAVVADGMGGMSSGDKVSAYTVSAMLEMRAQVSDMTPVHVRFTQMINAINSQVCSSGVGGGSTVAAVFCTAQGVHWCSLGDSRIYIRRGGMLFQISEDTDSQNMLLDDVISGALDYDDVLEDETKDRLAQYIGFSGALTPDTSKRPMTPETGDSLLICSDGVYNALSVGEMSRALQKPAQEAADCLIRQILEKGYSNQDNCTAVVLQFN